jgi:DNA repair exonuclease SbcCD nuclease subunit
VGGRLIMTRFIHAADIHLGFEQYGLPERQDDFYRAFLAVVETACSEDVDFVLVAGDMLHKAGQSDARALLQATMALERLRQAGIPVVAIEGNHEMQQAAEGISFPQYLNSIGLIHLLDFQSNQFGDIQVLPWEPESREGSYVDIAGARVFGLRYVGAQTARIIEEIAPLVVGEGHFTIAMLHAGLEGEVPHMHGGLRMSQLQPLKDRIDYLALGHVHKKLERDGWIYNPGSTETCSMEETGPDWPHGFFLVEIDGRGAFARVRFHSTAVRPFVRVIVAVEQAKSADDVMQLVESALDKGPDLVEGSVIEVTLAGVTQLNRHEVPEDWVRAAVDARCRPLTVRIRYSVRSTGVGLEKSQERTRQELEREVVEQLVRQHPGYRDHANAWAAVALDVMEMVREARPPASIVEYVENRRRAIEPGDFDSLTGSNQLTLQ